MVEMSKYAFILKLVDRFSNIIDDPTDVYVEDSLDMMQYILHNRKDISDNQAEIILDIMYECQAKKA